MLEKIILFIKNILKNSSSEVKPEPAISPEEVKPEPVTLPEKVKPKTQKKPKPTVSLKPKTPTKKPALSLSKLEKDLPISVLRQIKPMAKKFRIKSNLRLAHFLAQCAHESVDFKVTRENLNYSAKGLLRVFGKRFDKTSAEAYARKPEKIANKVYSNRMGNGDENSGDGWKYSGKGYIQLTGKINYTNFSKFINEDCVANPDLVATKYPLASAAFFFDSNDLWALCDKGANYDTLVAVTRRVNGGINGLADRELKFKKYSKLLGLKYSEKGKK